METQQHHSQSNKNTRVNLALIGEAYTRYMANTPAFFPHLSDGVQQRVQECLLRCGR